MEKTLSVSELTNIIKGTLESTFTNVVIEGEISNYKVYSSGHAYFTLKDDWSQISAVMFAGSLRYVAFQPRDGNKVRCRGKITVYPQRGNYQIIVSQMEQSGDGEILLMLEQRKQKLAAEGLFNSERKRKLPFKPDTIGVVTSPTGAAIRDILQITRRRNPSANVIVFPTLVQGELAAAEIERQIKTANDFELCDVLIVGRGGGSLEDLLPFSEENVVRAIADSRIPVISAVGHEIDWSLADYASDMRAPTPSAAAEIASPILEDILKGIDFYKTDMAQTLLQKVEKMKLMIKTFSKENLETQIRVIEQPLLNRYEIAKSALIENMTARVKLLRQTFENKKEILETSSPKNILSRGFSIVREKETGIVIRNAAQTKCGNHLEIMPFEGIINAVVES